MPLRERTIEMWLCEEAKRQGGLSLKMTQFIGCPDRILLFPGKPPIWIELKAPKGKLSPAQISVHKRLREQGFDVFTTSDREELRQIIQYAKGYGNTM